MSVVEEVQKKREEVVKDRVVKNKVNELIDNIGYEQLQVEASIVHNIARWVSSGMTDRDSLAYSLKITRKELDSWCVKYPEVIGAISIGEKVLNMKVGLTLGQIALGGYRTKKQIPIRLSEYNEYGRKIRDYVEVVTVEEETPPNFNAIKYILDNKESFDWGTKKEMQREEEKQKKIIETLSQEDTLNVLNMIKKTQEEIERETETYVLEEKDKEDK